MVAVSTDKAPDQQKLDQLLGGTFPLLSDPGVQVINAYQMRHQMGTEIVGNMGYVIIDRRGVVRKNVVDPLFGRHADRIVTSLKELQ